MFRHRWFAFLLLSGCISAKADTCSSLAGNLVKNCGFESGNFKPWTGSSTKDPDAGVDDSFPYQGTYEALLGTSAGADRLTQTLATTAGQTYTIQFYLQSLVPGSDFDPNGFAVDFGTRTLFAEVNLPIFSYQLFSFTDVAAGASTKLSFVNQSSEGYFDLDDVSVVADRVAATPEPSSFMLLATGALGVLGVARARGRQGVA